jgi:hypothetical protein
MDRQTDRNQMPGVYIHLNKKETKDSYERIKGVKIFQQLVMQTPFSLGKCEGVSHLHDAKFVQHYFFLKFMRS